MEWIEVSLVVDGEAAEAVADVLARFAPEGAVVIESTAIQLRPADDAPPVIGETFPDEGKPVGPLSVRCYLPVDEQLPETRRKLEEGLWHLGRNLPMPEPQFRPVADADWAEAWKADYRPIRIGRRLRIVPSWMEAAVEPDDVVIRLEPGMAFGTGTHPTTQLCLAALEEFLRPGQSVIDLGCGSGILSIAAAKLGARATLAVDIDPEAARVARVNCAANGVEPAVRVEAGSLKEILAGAFGLRSAEVVLANILARIIIQLAGEGLARLVPPGGVLIASGILEDQAGDVSEAITKQGLEVIAHRQIADWVALVARATL